MFCATMEMVSQLCLIGDEMCVFGGVVDGLVCACVCTLQRSLCVFFVAVGRCHCVCVYCTMLAYSCVSVYRRAEVRRLFMNEDQMDVERGECVCFIQYVCSRKATRGRTRV